MTSPVEPPAPGLPPPGLELTPTAAAQIAQALADRPAWVLLTDAQGYIQDVRLLTHDALAATILAARLANRTVG